MKKVLFVLVLMMSVLVINAQATKTTENKEKSIHTAIKVSDLKKSITDNIAKDYTGFTIKEAESVTKNNTLTYHVVIVKDATNTFFTLVQSTGNVAIGSTTFDATNPEKFKVNAVLKVAFTFLSMSCFSFGSGWGLGFSIWRSASGGRSR